jgi:signal transduction histidine kinase
MTGGGAATSELDAILSTLPGSSWPAHVEALRRVSERLASVQVDGEQEGRIVAVLERSCGDTKWAVRKAVAEVCGELRHPHESARRILDALAADSHGFVSVAAERARDKLRTRANSADEWTLSPDQRNPLLQRVTARIRDLGDFRAKPTRIYDLAMEVSEEAYRELAADMAHEIRTALTPLDGYLSDLERHHAGPPSSSDATRLVTSARERLRHVYRLLNDLRDYSASHREGFVSVDLAEVIRDAVALAAEQASPTIEKVVAVAPGSSVEGLRDRLVRAVANIVANACQAMTGRGTLTVEAAPAAPDCVEIIVRDTGCGMSPEMVEEARLRFRTTRRDHGGTGLGLPIAERIVTDDHGGEFLIESKVGEGTVVTMRLPTRQR